jgi:Domain of unknown function (DUF5018)
MHTLTRFFRPTLFWGIAFALAVASSCSKKEDVVPKSTDKTMTGFSFAGLTPAVAATISGNTVMATVPFGTPVTVLVPTITVSAKATVSPASGTAQDFSKTVTYTVTAEDGSTQVYSVAVGIGAAPKSMAKDITAFAFNGLTPAVNCAIDAATKTISATLAAGTDATKLVPTVTVSAKATVAPASGATQDFSKAVVYTVTAEDGTTQAYTANIVAPPAPVVTTKTIDCNTTIPEVWEDLGDGVDYVVKCNISINSTKVITIKPGVKIQFEGGNSGFYVTSQAALKMIGTAAKPIILEGKVATAGSWKGVELDAINIENQWEYVTIRYAGGGSNKAGLLLSGIDQAIRVSLKNCTFTDNTGYGIYNDDDFFAGNQFNGFENNVFTNNTKAALRIRLSEMGSLDSKSSFANNGLKYIEVAKSAYDSDVELNIKKIDVPYRITALFTLREKMVINPGVTMEFLTDAGFYISDSDKKPTIVADGTAAQPIKFVGYIANTKGVWAGIGIQNGSVETKLNYCIIDGAGSKEFFCIPATSKAAIYLGREVNCTDQAGKGTITNCTITNSGGYGIAYRLADAVTAKDNTYSGNTKADVFNFK